MKDSGLREPGVGDLRDPFPRHTVLLATALIPNRVSLPRYGCRVGLRIVLFEACSAFTRVTACTLALSPYLVTRLSEGFSHFVSSIAAPVASGWSRCRVGLAPTGKRRLCTARQAVTRIMDRKFLRVRAPKSEWLRHIHRRRLRLGHPTGKGDRGSPRQEPNRLRPRRRLRALRPRPQRRAEHQSFSWVKRIAAHAGRTWGLAL